MSIDTIEGLQEWLETQPPNVRAAIAYRHLLRYIRYVTHRYPQTEGATVWSPEVLLVPLRIALCLGLNAASILDVPNLPKEIRRKTSPTWTPHAILYRAGMLAYVPFSEDKFVTNLIRFIEHGFEYGMTAVFDDTKLTEEDLLRTPISIPSDLRSQQDGYISDSPDELKKGADWRFWDEWYDRAMAGNPLPWSLQREVALIPDGDWERGHDHIAEKIEEIQKRYELAKRIEELERELGRERVFARKARFGIGGNYPPERLDEEGEFQRQILIVWAAVEELKSETTAEIPDKARVWRIITTLSRGLVAILRWCATKSDLTVDTIIKWGVPMGGATLLAKPELLEAVINAAKAWLGLL